MVGLDPCREWVLACGERYWRNGSTAVAALPMPRLPLAVGLPGELTYVLVPQWASDIAVDGRLLAFAGCVSGDTMDSPDWVRCDWLAVAWHMMTGSIEREHESRNGPILSYAFRLPRSIWPLFDRAWVNRIFLFLRRWGARHRDLPEEQLFGPLPKASILLTHDVDAISLTPEIRLKQTAFQLVNAGRAAIHGRIPETRKRLADAVRYAFSASDLRTLPALREMERAAGLHSVLHFYGGPPGLRRLSVRRMLIDPAYDVTAPCLKGEIKALRDGGWEIGLHQSFEAWSLPELMETQRRRVEEAAQVPVTHCRQHWLHFSWEATWRAQERAGLLVDSTLGFNDRPGFRAGHALRLHPWDFAAAQPMRLEAVPMLFMDSHFYDYGQLAPGDIGPSMKRWIDEVLSVHGEATVNWHPHTITELYGWGAGFEELLGLLSSREASYGSGGPSCAP